MYQYVMRHTLIGRRRDRAGMGVSLHAHRLQNINMDGGTINDKPYRIQAFMYKPESEPKRESKVAETVEETQQDVSEW